MSGPRKNTKDEVVYTGGLRDFLSIVLSVWFPNLVILIFRFCELLMVVKSWHYTQSQMFLAIYVFLIGSQRCWKVKLIQGVTVALFYSVSIILP